MSKNPYLMHEDLQRAKRILAGDRQAFEEFFEDYFDPLFRFALSRVGDEVLAKDMVQSTFCKAVEKLDSYRGEAALLSWMCSICRFEISAYFKKQQREPAMDLVEDSPELQAVLESLAQGQKTVEDEVLLGELRRLVHLTLDHLPKHYGRALEWKYFEGLPVTEIASRLELGPKAAESLLTRARDAFRRAFHTVSRDIVSQRRSRFRLVPTGGPR